MSKSMTLPYGRSYCKLCHQRVFPYDGMERLTEAPGKGTLLFSENSRRAHHDPDGVKPRLAWCWNCNKWTETFKETFAMLMRRYESRKGVSVRGRRRRKAA